MDGGVAAPDGIFVGLDNAPSIPLLSAFLANPINLEGVPRSDIAMPAPNLLFDLSNFLREELYRSAALCADHVMMTAPVVLMLVAGDAIMKGDLAGQPAACQQLSVR